MKRFVTALVIAAAIYGMGLSAGSLLYATGAIATGATHNNCPDYHHALASQYGGQAQDVPQPVIKAAATQCLAGHELTAREAFRSEYLFGAAWPAAVFAAVYLAWPAWVAILRNQEDADQEKEVTRGQTTMGMA